MSGSSTRGEGFTAYSLPAGDITYRVTFMNGLVRAAIIMEPVRERGPYVFLADMQYSTCPHAYGHGRRIGRCLENYTCRICGGVKTIDSGD